MESAQILPLVEMNELVFHFHSNFTPTFQVLFEVQNKQLVLYMFIYLYFWYLYIDSSSQCTKTRNHLALFQLKNFLCFFKSKPLQYNPELEELSLHKHYSKLTTVLIIVPWPVFANLLNLKLCKCSPTIWVNKPFRWHWSLSVHAKLMFQMSLCFNKQDDCKL